MIHQNFECEFYFIRHGQSESNATPEYLSGSIDSSLTPKGFEQARLLGERFKEDGITFDRVYSSSLLRTVQTTQTMLEAMGEPDRDFPRIDAIIEQKGNRLDRIAHRRCSDSRTAVVYAHEGGPVCTAGWRIVQYGAEARLELD